MICFFEYNFSCKWKIPHSLIAMFQTHATASFSRKVSFFYPPFFILLCILRLFMYVCFMIRTIIVDDEKDAAEGLSLLLGAHCPDVQILGIAHSASEGIKAIKTGNPDLVMLDVEMPHGSGFTVLNNLPEINFKTIFVTAYSHYALKAIKFSALDYLLKPVDVDDLCAAIEKVHQCTGDNVKERQSILLENLQTDKPGKLAVPIKDGFQYLTVSEIIRIEGEGSYCTFFLAGGCRIVVSHNLGVYEELLAKNNFYRTHQSHLVNISHIYQYLRSDGGMVIMSDKSSVPVSRRNKEGFLQMLHLSK